MDNPDVGAQGVESPEGSASAEQSQAESPKFEGPEWMSSMPDDVKASTSLTKFKDVENLARGYMNAERLLGRDKIPMPKTDEEFATVYAKLGCPADVKEYDVKVEGKIPKDLTSTFKEDLKAFLPVAKSAGLNNKQASAIFNLYANMQVEAYKNAAVRRDLEFTNAKAAIDAEFGEAAPVKLALANRVISHLGGEEVVNAIAASGLGRNPAFVKMMVKLGERHAEELGIDKTGNSGMVTPATLKQQIADLQASPAYWDATHPEHKTTVERVRQLFERMPNA